MANLDRVSADNERSTQGLTAVGIGGTVPADRTRVDPTQLRERERRGAVLGIIASPIASIVAAYFGIAAGASGKAQAEESAKKANKTVARLAAAGDPAEAQSIITQVYGDPRR